MRPLCLVIRRVIYRSKTQCWRLYSGVVSMACSRRERRVVELSHASHKRSGQWDWRATYRSHAKTNLDPFFPLPFQPHLRQTARARRKATELRATPPQSNPDSPDSQVEEDGRPHGRDGSNTNLPSGKPSPTVEVLLARLLTDTLASLTREFERDALASGEVRETGRHEKGHFCWGIW